MLNRRHALISSLALAALASGASQAQTAPTVWRFAHTQSIPGTVWNKYATEVLPERIKQVTDGAVQIQVMTGVIPAADLMSNIRAGAVQGGSLTLPYVGSTLPIWNIMALPGLVNDEAKYPAFVNNILLPYMRDDARKRFKAEPVMLFAFTGAAWFSNGPNDTLAKIPGKKFRTHSPELNQLIQAAGGAAVPMLFGEVSGGLQKGMIDAYTASIPSANAAKLYEATKYAELWPAGLGGSAFFIGEDALAKLPSEMRKRVVDEFAKLNLESQQASLEEAKTAARQITENGMKIIQIAPAERERMVALAREKVWPLWIKNAGPRGEQILKSAQEALK